MAGDQPGEGRGQHREQRLERVGLPVGEPQRRGQQDEDDEGRLGADGGEQRAEDGEPRYAPDGDDPGNGRDDKRQRQELDEESYNFV